MKTNGNKLRIPIKADFKRDGADSRLHIDIEMERSFPLWRVRKTHIRAYPLFKEQRYCMNIKQHRLAFNGKIDLPARVRVYVFDLPDDITLFDVMIDLALYIGENDEKPDKAVKKALKLWQGELVSQPHHNHITIANSRSEEKGEKSMP